jgi:hypothetical protein
VPSGIRIPVVTHSSTAAKEPARTDTSSFRFTLVPATAAASTARRVPGLDRASRAPTASRTVGGTDGHPPARISVT